MYSFEDGKIVHEEEEKAFLEMLCAICNKPSKEAFSVLTMTNLPSFTKGLPFIGLLEEMPIKTHQFVLAFVTPDPTKQYKKHEDITDIKKLPTCERLVVLI